MRLFIALEESPMRRLAMALGIVCECVLLLSMTASAQQRASIVGVVQDASGAVMPGVSVEASGPALIERVRSAVTDGAGRYSIIDLRRPMHEPPEREPSWSARNLIPLS
jgi:hypothetical protein